MARIRVAFASPATIRMIQIVATKLPPREAPQRAAVDTMRWPLEAATTAVLHPRRWATSVNSFRADSVWQPLVRTTTRKQCCLAATMSISRARQQQELDRSNWQREEGERFDDQVVPNGSDLVGSMFCFKNCSL